jgi:cobalamin biosynthesis Mg chelatase CobN
LSPWLSGALKKAAENIANAPDRSGKNTVAPPRAQPAPSQGRADSDQQGGKGGTKKKRVVKVSIVEAFTKDVEPQELEATLRLEYRSKLLNPKWAEAMAAQGSGGAYEISQRMTALVGWSSTAGFQDQWVYDGAVERYVLDEKMAQKLMDNNPEAMRNVVKRMLEANGRGYWEATPEVLEHLREMYAAAEDEIELSGGKGVRNKVLREDGGEKSAPTPREEVKMVSSTIKNVKEERTPVVSR